MSLRRLYNLTMASGNPSYLTGILAGGTSTTQVAGTTPNPMIGLPRVETCEMEVLNVTATSTTVHPVVVGQLVVQDLTVQSLNPASQGGGTWRKSTTANAKIPRSKYGIVTIPPFNDPNNPATAVSGTSSGLKMQVATDGPVMALCVTTSAISLTPGTLLSADALGNLHAAPGSPGPGEVLAVCAGNLGWSISTATLVPVDIGGM